jgi:hypothetical protein
MRPPIFIGLKRTPNSSRWHDQFSACGIQSSQSRPRDIEQSARRCLTTNIVCGRDKAQAG